MKKKLIIPNRIVCTDKEGRILRNETVEIESGLIKSIRHFTEDEITEFDGEVIRAESLTLIPGFIQTHIHLCQSLFRGLADDLDLIDWLRFKIFPLENAHNEKSLSISVRIGLNELMRGGTTTVLDMGTLNHQQVIFEELINSGMRAFAGKCLMDINTLFPEFKNATDYELAETYNLAKEYHGKLNGKVRYGFAPRFVLSCSEKLLKESKEMMKDFDGSVYHTHASENPRELEEVRKKFNTENITYFNSIGALDDHTILAHCVHINYDELNILKKKNVRVAHCPSSNLKLGSGIADIPKFIGEGIQVSLGADGAPCNNNLSAFIEMRLAALIQKPIYGPEIMDAETIFRLATIEGAKALHIENETGSIEAGKKADLVLLDLNTPYNSMDDNDYNVYGNIVYSASRGNVVHVMIDGEWVVKDGQSLNYDEHELYFTGKTELDKLIARS
jgi:5-methylthioadenosine/S-adenosylhomocysteine deaminase